MSLAHSVLGGHSGRVCAGWPVGQWQSIWAATPSSCWGRSHFAPADWWLAGEELLLIRLLHKITTNTQIQIHKYKFENTNPNTQMHKSDGSTLYLLTDDWLWGKELHNQGQIHFLQCFLYLPLKKIIQCFAQVRDQVQCGQHRWSWLPSVCCLLSTEEGFQIGDTWKSAPPHIQHVCSVSENIRISKEWYLDLTRSSNVVHSERVMQ